MFYFLLILFVAFCRTNNLEISWFMWGTIVGGIVLKIIGELYRFGKQLHSGHHRGGYAGGGTKTTTPPSAPKGGSGGSV